MSVFQLCCRVDADVESTELRGMAAKHERPARRARFAGLAHTKNARLELSNPPGKGSTDQEPGPQDWHLPVHGLHFNWIRQARRNAQKILAQKHWGNGGDSHAPRSKLDECLGLQSSCALRLRQRQKPNKEKEEPTEKEPAEKGEGKANKKAKDEDWVCRMCVHLLALSCLEDGPRPEVGAADTAAKKQTVGETFMKSLTNTTTLLSGCTGRALPPLAFSNFSLRHFQFLLPELAEDHDGSYGHEPLEQPCL